MKNKYKLRELTPENMSCAVFNCPAIYEVETECVIGGCPTIKEHGDSYLIAGQKVNPKDFGLEGKVGDNEVLIKVPKKLIDEKQD